jgi:enoyl-[acyl-carrier protein] reductase II
VRAIVNDAARRFTLFQREVIDRFRSGELDQKAAQLEIEHFWVGALRKAVIEGDVENGSLMAGQSVGMVAREQPTAEIIAELIDQAVTALRQRSPGERSPVGALA